MWEIITAGLSQFGGDGGLMSEEKKHNWAM